MEETNIVIIQGEVIKKFVELNDSCEDCCICNDTVEEYYLKDIEKPLYKLLEEQIRGNKVFLSVFYSDDKKILNKEASELVAEFENQLVDGIGYDDAYVSCYSEYTIESQNKSFMFYYNNRYVESVDYNLNNYKYVKFVIDIK